MRHLLDKDCIEATVKRLGMVSLNDIVQRNRLGGRLESTAENLLELENEGRIVRYALESGVPIRRDAYGSSIIPESTIKEIREYYPDWVHSEPIYRYVGK